MLGTSQRLIGSQPHVLEPVSPDATIELQLPESARVELMVEYGRSDDLYETHQRLQRYDLFLSGGAPAGALQAARTPVDRRVRLPR
jgi:hypothetical protein